MKRNQTTKPATIMKKFLLIMLAAMGTLPLSAQTPDTIDSR